MLKDAYNELTDKDKIYILSFALLTCMGVVLVLLGIAMSRGYDVDYFKERVHMFEARLNTFDKKTNDVVMEQLKQTDRLNDTRNDVLEIQRKQAEYEKWLEDYKRLPVLPRSTQPQSQPLRPTR